MDSITFVRFWVLACTVALLNVKLWGATKYDVPLFSVSAEASLLLPKHPVL